MADQCELAGVPCITSDDPWQAWFFPRKGDPKKGFDWTYHFFWGFDMVADLFADMWLSLPTNKKVGLMLTNDQDGIAASNPEHGIASHFKKKGLEVIDLGLYPPLSDDFTSQIAATEEATTARSPAASSTRRSSRRSGRSAPSRATGPRS